jgi:hypothetical protein
MAPKRAEEAAGRLLRVLLTLCYGWERVLGFGPDKYPEMRAGNAFGVFAGQLYVVGDHLDGV